MVEYFEEVEASEFLRPCAAADPVAMHKATRTQHEMPTLIDTSARRNDLAAWPVWMLLSRLLARYPLFLAPGGKILPQRWDSDVAKISQCKQNECS
jgi:hypothetical protein